MGKLKHNLIYHLSYMILTFVLSLATAPYLSRVLGVDGTGIYSYVFSVAYYFYIATILGLTNYGNRAIAKVRNDRQKVSKTFWSIYFMQLTIGLVALAAYLIFIFFIAEANFKLYYILFIPYVVSAVIDINWFYFGLSDFKFTTIRSTVIKLISVICAFAFVKTKDDLVVYFIIMGSTYFFISASLWARVKKNVDFYFPKFRESLVHLKPNLILFIPIFAVSVYMVMDKIMIKELSSITQNGYYENADKIVAKVLTVFSAVATVMMPSVSNMVAQGKKDEIKALLRDTMQISMFLGVGMTFGLVAVGRTFAPIFYGAEFQEAGVLIQLLSVIIVFSGWKAVLRSQYIIPYEKDKAYVISLVAGAVMNVIFNYHFIPIYRARGAVIGTIAAEVTGFVIQTAAAAGDIDVWRMMREGAIFVLPGALMAGVVTLFLHLCNNGVFTLCCAILIGAAVYPVFAVLTMRVCDKDRLAFLHQRYFAFVGRKTFGGNESLDAAKTGELKK